MNDKYFDVAQTRKYAACSLDDEIMWFALPPQHTDKLENSLADTEFSELTWES